MISRRSKEIFFTLMGSPMKLNGIFYRRFRAPHAGIVKAHLGPGKGKYLVNWINVDANCFTAKCDVWTDLRCALPFPDLTVDVFYSHHMIEHLPDYLLDFHFTEMYRCLKPGGCIRVACPNGDVAIQKFIEGDKEWFGDWPDKRKSIGGRFVNFLLCGNEHMTILTSSYIQELASAAGFIKFVQCRPRFETHYPLLIDTRVLETEQEKPNREFPDTLVIECQKPII